MFLMYPIKKFNNKLPKILFREPNDEELLHFYAYDFKNDEDKVIPEYYSKKMKALIHPELTHLDLINLRDYKNLTSLTINFHPKVLNPLL